MGKGESTVFPQNPESVFRSVINPEALEKWQRRFCSLVNVFMCCVDSQGVLLTEFDGQTEETERIKKIIDAQQLQSMLLRVSKSTLEDQAVENTVYPNLKVAAVAIKKNGKTVISWLVCGVLSDVDEENDYAKPALTGFQHIISEKQFMQAVDVLGAFTGEMIEYKLSMINAREESQKSRFSEQEMSENLKRSETLTQVVQLLESEENIEMIMGRLLTAAGKFLQLSIAAIYRIRENSKDAELVSGWSKEEGAVGSKSRIADGCLSFFRTGKTTVISSNSLLKQEEKEALESLEITAIIVIPVTCGGAADMYACFSVRKAERIWTIEEIKFLNDTVKILQSILSKRIRENSLADVDAFLDTLLDNVGSAVYVRDAATGKMFFANRNMRHIFEEEIKGGTLDELLDQGIRNENGISEIYHRMKERWYDLHYTGMRWLDGTEVLLCSLYDITEKKNYQTENGRKEDL